MNILLATDGSPFSQAAGDLLTRLPWPSPSELTVLSVVDKLEPPSTTEKSDQDPTYQAVQQAQRALRQDVHHLLVQEAERFRTLGWTPQTQIREGDAAHEIVSAAAEMGADVIATGSRGMGGIKRFLLGSVFQQVMTYAPCSVLIARSANEKTAPPADNDTPLRLLLAYDGSPTAKAAVETIAALPLHDHTHILITTVMALMTYYRMDVLPDHERQLGKRQTRRPRGPRPSRCDLAKRDPQRRGATARER